MTKVPFKILQKVCFLCTAVFALFLFACATSPSAEDIKKAETYYNVGASYFAKNELQEAFVEFQRAIKLNPEDKHALNALGLIKANFKEYEEAISYYKRAIAVDPGYSEALNNLGVAYLDMKNWDEAITYFKSALENPLYLTPEKAYSNLGYAYYKKGSYQEAISALKKAIKRYPDHPQPLYVLGLVFMKLGRVADAIEEFKRAVDIVPKFIDARWELANAYLRIGDKKNAVKHFKVISEDKNSNRNKEALEYLELLRE